DLYSLGCTLYYLLTGRVPYPGGTALEKLIRHNTAEPAPIEQLRPDVPSAVATIVRKLMAKRPEDRYQTPADVVAALEPFSVSGSTPWDSLSGGADGLPDLITPPPQEGSDPVMPAGGGLVDTSCHGGRDPFSGGPLAHLGRRLGALPQPAAGWGVLLCGGGRCLPAPPSLCLV